MFQLNEITFYREEVRDLAIAWVALGLAFTFFLTPTGFVQDIVANTLDWNAFGRTFVLSMLTVGAGFLLHELAHKIVAIRFGQVAAFRADYGMLAVAIGLGLAGLLFAAPGAVYHRGRITVRQNGLVSVAGPVTNLLLAVVFLVPFLLAGGFVQEIARIGVLVNIFLAAFNMIPFGPLDGKTVKQWSVSVFAFVFSVSLLALGAFFLFVGL